MYIDGNHTYEFVKKDLLCYIPKVKPGGYIICDDYFTDIGEWWSGGVKVAVDEMVANGILSWVNGGAQTTQAVLMKVL